MGATVFLNGGAVAGSFRLGVALSGGTAKSVAHIGVLKALEENDIRIDFLGGTSGGSIVAVLYAAGKSIRELEELAEGLSWRDLASLTLPKLGLLSGNKIRKFIINEIGNIEFKDLKIPTVIVAADLTTGEEVLFKEGEVAVACQASSSIPEVYTPVDINGHAIVDGGLIEYLPIRALGGFGEMFRLGVNLGYERHEHRKPRHLIEVVMQVTGFIAHHNAIVSEKYADFVIRPELERFNPFALNRASDMINEGYRAATAAMPELKDAIRKYSSLPARIKRFLNKKLF